MASPSSTNDSATHAGRKSARHRQLAIWTTLVALVLGSAYLASRPGSDSPAANGPSAPRSFAAIDRYVEDEMAAQRIPGLALTIVEGDRVAYVRGFGKADDSEREVTPKTPFVIGSLSKSFTALPRGATDGKPSQECPAPNGENKQTACRGQLCVA